MGEELPGSIDIDKLYEDSTSKLDVKKEESPAKKPLQPFKIDYDQLWNNDADLQIKDLLIESTKIQPSFVEKPKKGNGKHYVKPHEPFSIFKPMTYP